MAESYRHRRERGTRGWADRLRSSDLGAIHFSGSYAKGTAISLGTDVDIFVSVDCGQPVKEIYWSFLRLLHRLQQVGTVPAMDIMNVCGESG